MSVFEQRPSGFGKDYSYYQAKDKEWLKRQIWGNAMEAHSYVSLTIDPKLLFELIDMMDDYSRGYSDGWRDYIEYEKSEGEVQE